MANTYDIGDVVRLSSAFAQNAVALDPGTVAVKLLKPDASATTYTYGVDNVIKDSVGNYHMDVAPLLSGTYRYRWVSTGVGAAAEETWFQVRKRLVL